MRAWHDYHLTAYTVDGENGRISFQLVWPYRTETDVRRATVIFSGVVGHFFAHDLGVSIVLAFEERPIVESLEKYLNQFEEGEKWGWPPFWRGNVESTVPYLEEQRVRFFEISTSYGLSGWVCAKDVAHEVH
jgi:hypothetical protein